ncbi:hypothetical protein D3C85_1721450 [compost metagenome]
MGGSHIFGQVSKAKAGQRRLKDGLGPVEDKRPIDSNADLLFALLELPRVEFSVAHQPQIDAVVVGQVLRFQGKGALGEVGG